MSATNSIESCESCAVRWKNFSHLSRSELNLVNENRYEATFKPGEIIIKQGSPSSNALFLSSGLAKNYIEGVKGRNFIMSIIKPGMLVVGPGAYINSRHTYTVSALTFVQVCFVNFGVLRQLVRTNGAFAEGLLEDISMKSLKMHTRMVNLAQKRMPGRLAEVILYLSGEVFGTDEFAMILSRQELGEMTNMAKENVVRIMREMESSGIIISKDSKVRILDREKLEQISQKG
jgi:CRP-like cAMP-binding protein